MEKLIKKIRSLTMTLFILSLISLIWLAVDFFILKSFNTQYNYNFQDFNWIMFIGSFIPILLTIILIFFLSPFVWRLKSKYNSELKKMKSEQNKKDENGTKKLIEEKSE
jgi:TRAP-type C4-dicarboxylate transport system permease small subunit